MTKAPFGTFLPILCVSAALLGALLVFAGVQNRSIRAPMWWGAAYIIGAAGLGSTIGITLGSVLRNVRPDVTVVVALVVDAARALAASGLGATQPWARRD